MKKRRLQVEQVLEKGQEFSLGYVEFRISKIQARSLNKCWKNKPIRKSLKHDWFSNIPKLLWLRTELCHRTLYFTAKKWSMRSTKKDRDVTAGAIFLWQKPSYIWTAMCKVNQNAGFTTAEPKDPNSPPVYSIWSL